MDIIDVTEKYIINAKPNTGNVIQDNGYNPNGHDDEIRVTKWIVKKPGGDVRLLKESLEPGVRTPDYLWQDKFWELKSPHSMNTIDDAIRGGIRQIERRPGGIILYYRKVAIDINKIKATALRRLQRSNVKSFDIMIIDKTVLKAVFSCKK